MDRLISFIYRIFFVGAFVLLGLALWEKAANMMGLTLLRGYSPVRVLELSVIVLVFVIALQLRQIRAALERKI